MSASGVCAPVCPPSAGPPSRVRACRCHHGYSPAVTRCSLLRTRAPPPRLPLSTAPASLPLLLGVLLTRLPAVGDGLRRSSRRGSACQVLLGDQAGAAARAVSFLQESQEGLTGRLRPLDSGRSLGCGR